jgi:hypothetical protein
MMTWINSQDSEVELEEVEEVDVVDYCPKDNL